MTQHQAAITLGIGPTINQCELLAIYQAAEWLVNNSLSSHTISKTELSTKGKTPLTIILSKYKYELLCISKSDLRLLTELLSGHSSLNYFKFIQHLVPTPWCTNCAMVSETTEHFLCKCPAYSLLRISYFGVAITSINYIAANIKPKIIVKFVKATNRFQ